VIKAVRCVELNIINFDDSHGTGRNSKKPKIRRSHRYSSSCAVRLKDSSAEKARVR